jgi:type II secretory pathway pseudopilin PulG
VELMMVVALIGVLSAIAIPSFMNYQARSRRSEAFVNLAAVARVQKTYQATKGEYFDTGGLPWPDYTAAPYGALGTHKMDWDAASEAAWGGLGWAPEGDVYYSYQSNVCCNDGLCFTASAYGDVDADGLGSAAAAPPSAPRACRPRSTSGPRRGPVERSSARSLSSAAPTSTDSGTDSATDSDKPVVGPFSGEA